MLIQSDLDSYEWIVVLWYTMTLAKTCWDDGWLVSKKSGQKETLTKFVRVLLFKWVNIYHFIMTLPQVNPLPKAASTTKSPSFTFPCSQASVSAMGIEAAVVFPYLIILLKT